MATKVFRQGGFISIEQGNNTKKVPLRNFKFNFVGPSDTIELSNNLNDQESTYEDFNLIQDEGGSSVGGTKELVEDYLSSLTDTF